MGGRSVAFPEPTEEERGLQREQINILRSQQSLVEEQARQQELLAPFLFESAGLIPRLDETGRIIGFDREEVDTTQQDLLAELQEQALRQQISVLGLTEEELMREQEVDPLADLRQGIERQELERIDAALRGELPISPGLERELIEGRDRLETRLRQQLGPGFATSTPGIQALAEFDQRALEVREASRQGQLSEAEQIALGREQANLFRQRAGEDFGLRRLPTLQGLSAAGGGFGTDVTVGEFGRLFGGTGSIAQRGLATAGGFGASAAGFEDPLSALFA